MIGTLTWHFHNCVIFNGIIYDVSKPDGIHTKELIRAMIDSKYD